MINFDLELFLKVFEFEPMKHYQKYLGVGLLWIISYSISFAATITVSNTNDAGTGSLRDAVSNANYGDVVKLDPALLSGGSDTIHLESTITITKGMFIEGTFNSTDTLFISGGDSVQLFHIQIGFGAILPNVELDSLVLIHGSGDYGGAIKLSYEHSLYLGLTKINNCILRNNSASYGGAIGSYRDVTGGGPAATVQLALENTTIINNSCTNQGGGIYLRMRSFQGEESKIDLDLTNSSVVYNTAGNDGGGIYCYAYTYNGVTVSPDGAFTYIDIEKSTISENESGDAGGGLYSYVYDNTSTWDAISDIRVVTSTFTNNKAISNGGGIYSWSQNDSEIDVYSSTFAYNRSFLDGSAFYNETNSGHCDFSMSNSIFAFNDGNSSYDNTFYNVGTYEAKTSWGYSIYDAATVPATNLGTSYFNVSEPQLNLEPLALNPNGTYTRIPGTGSIAINNTSPSNVSDAQNGPAVGVRDIGAAESSFCGYIPVTIKDTICSGNTYNFNGQMLTSTGLYYDTTLGTSCDTAFTLDLLVNPSVTPTVDVSITPNNIIMTGTSVSFTANITNGGSNPTYEWYVNGTPQGLNGPSVTSSNLNNGDEIYCVITSDAECATTIMATSDVVEMIVHANNDDPCDAIEIFVHQSCEFSFFNNDGATDSPLVGDNSCAPTSGNDIWIKYRAPSDNDIAFTTLQGTLTDAVITIYEGGCNGLFESGCIDDVGNEKMPFGIIINNEYEETYYIRISSWNTGSFAICLEEINNTGINNNHIKEVLVYPNPASQRINLDFGATNNPGTREIMIANTLGETVYTGESNEQTTSLDISFLENGMYFVRIFQNGELIKNAPISIVR